METVEERLNELAFLNRGIEITFVDERVSMAEVRRQRDMFKLEEDGEIVIDEDNELAMADDVEQEVELLDSSDSDYIEISDDAGFEEDLLFANEDIMFDTDDDFNDDDVLQKGDDDFASNFDDNDFNEDYVNNANISDFV